MSTQIFWKLSKKSKHNKEKQPLTKTALGEIPADAKYGLRTNHLVMVLHTDLHAFTRNFNSFLLFKIQYN